MINFTLYDKATGRITGSASAPHDIALLQESDVRGVILAPYPGDGFMVEGGSFVVRPWLDGFDKTEIRADGTDMAVLDGLPDPCTVVIDGQPHTVTGGRLELTAAYKGTYCVEINQFPLMPYEESISCV